MNEILIKVLQLILSLSILVIFHELGHFIPAKLFKTKVDKFYLFFDPWFSLFKIKRGETEYGIGWIPLGGYVKIAGMIDESMDKEQMKKPPQPWEFRSKPVWQRLIIMLGGVTVNVLLAIAIYIAILFTWGEQYLPTSNVKYGITCDSLAMEMGLRNGDKIISLDNKKVDKFRNIPIEILLNDIKTIQVNRNEKVKEIQVPDGFVSKIIKNKSSDFISLRIPVEVGGFAKNSPAKNAGMLINDKIIGINDVETAYFDEFRKEIVKHKNKKIAIVVIRNNNDTTKVNVNVSEKGLIGIALKDPNNYFKLKKQEYSFFEAIPKGTVKAYKAFEDYLKQLRLIFSPETEAYKSVGSFIAIGNIFPSVWNWRAFWTLTAFLSIILAIMNLLPIPALDGGHVVFLLYEIITGKKPSDKFMEYAQITGMVIIFLLLILATSNDISNYILK